MSSDDPELCQSAFEKMIDREEVERLSQKAEHESIREKAKVKLEKIDFIRKELDLANRLRKIDSSMPYVNVQFWWEMYYYGGYLYGSIRCRLIRQYTYCFGVMSVNKNI